MNSIKKNIGDALNEFCYKRVGEKQPYQPIEGYPAININKLKNGQNIFIACFPKSGSTYLTDLLRKITGYQVGHTVQYYAHNEQDISETRLQYLVGKKVVIQQHAKGTCNNIQLMEKYKILPTVLVRNIFDVVISAADHIKNEDNRGPSVFIHSEYDQMSETEKLDFLISNLLPWYLSFFASWRHASETYPVIFVTYEQLFSNQLSVVKKILDYYNILDKYDDNFLLETISSMPVNANRKNVGRSGRGNEILNDVQKNHILSLVDSWKINDESLNLIGIN